MKKLVSTVISMLLFLSSVFRICKRTHFLHFGVSRKSSNIFRSNLT